MDLIADYDNKREIYNSFAKTVSDLVDRLMAAKSISYHSISFRCKTRESLERKVDIKQSYEALEDITDLAGVRVITHFSDDVDVVASMVESEFKIDKINSIDKRAALDPDRFGYLSLHYVVSLKKERETLQEYSAFKGLKLEIQIRSILQHTWAEIEHDIGYKSSVEVPRGIRRKFSRMAGLLELADQEFAAIRLELGKYEKFTAAEAIKNPTKVLLDKVTFISFVTQNELCVDLDREVTSTCNFKLFEAPKNSAKQLLALAMFDIDTVDKLKKALTENKTDVLRRIKDVSATRAEAKASLVSPGISIFYLTQILASKSTDPDFLDRFSELKGFGSTFKEYLRNFQK